MIKSGSTMIQLNLVCDVGVCTAPAQQFQHFGVPMQRAHNHSCTSVLMCVQQTVTFRKRKGRGMEWEREVQVSL
jgi:hypothetical protein